jgi:hypothetical protein
MHKDELIQLHTLLCQLKNWFENNRGTPGSSVFKEYETYGVAPQHIHKSKLQHKRAVFLLGKELADAIGGAEEFSGAHRVGHRMSELAKKVSAVKRLDPVPTPAHT